jgi:hypothetical protein
MAPRVIKLCETAEPEQEIEQQVRSQSKRPEVGRFLLQVDRLARDNQDETAATIRMRMAPGVADGGRA